MDLDVREMISISNLSATLHKNNYAEREGFEQPDFIFLL